jgi:hypothetical protein
VQADQVAVGVEAGRHLALRDRMIGAVRHVLFARPQQLDRRARHLLGDQHGLAHIVVARPRRPKPPPRNRLVDVALRPAAGGFGRAASAASPFWVGHQTSHLSGV